MQPIHSAPDMDVAGIPARWFVTTLEGKVKAKVARYGRRAWSLGSEGAAPEEVGLLMAYTLGEFGLGPFSWVSPLAASTNALAPEVSLCGPAAAVDAGVTVGGAVQLPGGAWAGRSLVNSAPATTMRFGPDEVPTVPGQSVTGSAWLVASGARLRLVWLNASGAFLSEVLSAPVVGSTAQRAVVTGVAPAGAALVRLAATGAVAGARPAISWTDGVVPWGIGDGCSRVIVEAVDRTVRRASLRVSGPRYSGVSFTIREVG